MEFELFRSKLKPLVDHTLIPNIIESSPEGERPHHAVAIGLILEGSIQERRKRMLEKVKNASRPDSTSQPDGGNEIPTASIPQAQPLAPAPQQLSQLSTSVPATASAHAETAPESSTLPQPGKETEI